MQLVILYGITAVVFLALDAVMLKFVMKPLFQAHLGSALADQMRLAPAVVFYCAYVAALLYLVSLPSLRADTPVRALLDGAIVGFVAYGTYEFTSYAIMRDWRLTMVAADVAWGTALTALSAWAGVVVVRGLS